MPPSELDTTDTPRGSREETHHVGNETPARTEQPSKPEADAQRTDNRRSIATETRTREEYADSVRSQDPPSGEGPRHDTDSAHQSAPASEPRDQTSAPDQAEPHDQETYAGDIRSPASQENPDGTSDGGAHDRAAVGAFTGDGSREPNAEPAESRSRDEYADVMREGQPVTATFGDAPAAGHIGTGDDRTSSETSATEPLNEGGDAGGTPDQADERAASNHAHADSDPAAEAAEPESRNGRDNAPPDLTDAAGRSLLGDPSSVPDVPGLAGDHVADAALSRPDQLHENELAPSETSSGETASRIDSPVAQRPDMAARHPADYVPSPDPPPRVDRPHEQPESWSTGINPGKDSPGRDNNCGECSRAVDSTWSGHPTAAAAMSDPDAPGEPISRMTDWASAAPAPASLSEVGHRLDTLGPGSSAIVGCDWKYGGGHWFNAVNDGGTVKAVDGQSGEVETWPPSSRGLGFDESDMHYSDAIFFTPDGKAAQ